MMEDPSAAGDEQNDQPRWFWTWDRRSQRAVSVLLAALAIVVGWWWWSGQPGESVVASPEETYRPVVFFDSIALFYQMQRE